MNQYLKLFTENKLIGDFKAQSSSSQMYTVLMAKNYLFYSKQLTKPNSLTQKFTLSNLLS